MNYIELRDKLQKTVSILENKRWNSTEELEQAAVVSIGDFLQKSGLPLFKVGASEISLVLADYPSDLQRLYTYQFVFKSDKRKPDGYSDFLLRMVLEPAVPEEFREMDIWDLFGYMNRHAALLHSEQMLLQEQEHLMKKLRKINEELAVIQKALEKY